MSGQGHTTPLVVAIATTVCLAAAFTPGIAQANGSNGHTTVGGPARVVLELVDPAGDTVPWSRPVTIPRRIR